MRILLNQPRKVFNLSRVIIALAVILTIRAVAFAQQPPSAAPADAQATTAAPDSTPIPALAPLDLFKKAGYFIWPLAACSVLSVTLIIERFIALRRNRVIRPTFFPG